MKNLNEKILVVCDRDSRYANGLGENISERKELAVQVYICSCIESMKQFLEGKNPDILIVDESFSQEERKEMQAIQTFVLTKEECRDLGEHEKPVLKFQSADKILGVVFETYYNQTNNSILKTVKKPRQRLLAVYSPIHRIGKTEFALALGNELAKSERTLYLNLEVFPDVDARFLRVEERNLGDLLYYMRQEEQNIAMRVASMVEKRENLDVLPPMLSCGDLKSVSALEWRALLEQILDVSAYETMVLDLGDGVQDLIELLSFCDGIYMPVLEDEISCAKLRQFEYNLELQGMTALQEKIHRFTVPSDMKVYAKQLMKEDE